MAEKVELKTVKWVLSHPNFVAVKGDEGEVRQDMIEKFCLDGCVLDEKTNKRVRENKLPEYVAILK